MKSKLNTPVVVFRGIIDDHPHHPTKVFNTGLPVMFDIETPVQVKRKTAIGRQLEYRIRKLST